MFLPVDTQVTATLDEHRDETGGTWTTVTINHDHLPVEWIDDLHAWWMAARARARVSTTS